MTVEARSEPQATPDAQATPEAERGPSLSPSRAADFKTCPLLYRFRVIDKIPERPTPDQVRGTLVHAVLERLFDLPAQDRTPERAAESLEPEWRRLLEEQPEFDGLFEQPDAAAEWLASARELLTGYFTLEDPQRLEPAERESLVEVKVGGDQLRLRGIIDRLDVSPSGDIRVVDYKTGGAPREAFEARALFQLKFYALVLWRARGVAPRALRLVYLSDRQVCDYTPDVEELRRFERNLLALWQAIERATERGDFRPKPSRLCDWCSHQALCPAYGGEPPPYPGPPAAGEPDVAVVSAADPPQGGGRDQPG